MCTDIPKITICNGSGGGNPMVRQRKFSFPVNLQSSLLQARNSLTPDTGSLPISRRRFSHVGDAFSRKFSTTIGWRLPPLAVIPIEELSRQGKTLCGQYIRHRLKRTGLFNKKCGLQRLRSAISLPEGELIREIFPDLLGIGSELERMHPKLYMNVAKQTNGIILSEKSVRKILLTVSRGLFRSEITWAKIVSLFAVAAGLATDCVRADHLELVSQIIAIVGDIVADDLGPWIHEAGGWIALQSYCKPKKSQLDHKTFCIYAGSAFLAIMFFFFVIRWLARLHFY